MGLALIPYPEDLETNQEGKTLWHRHSNIFARASTEEEKSGLPNTQQEIISNKQISTEDPMEIVRLENEDPSESICHIQLEKQSKEMLMENVDLPTLKISKKENASLVLQNATKAESFLPSSQDTKQEDVCITQKCHIKCRATNVLMVSRGCHTDSSCVNGDTSVEATGFFSSALISVRNNDP